MAVYVSNINIETGTNFSQVFTLEDVNTNSPLNLSGYTVNSQMRKHPASSGVTTFTTNLSDPTAGQLQIGLSTTQTLALKPGRYVYDVLVTDTSSNVSRVVEGMAIVSQGVTR